MLRYLTLAVGLLLASGTQAGAVGIDGLNEARDVLMREFKGAQVRCRVDILAATPYWSWDVMTTGTPHGVAYLNHTQPVVFEALSLVQMREFDVRNGGIRVVVTTPGFDLKRLGRVGWDLLTLSRQDARSAEVRATRMENVQCVFLQCDRVDDMRAALASLFYLGDEQPPMEEIQACLDRNWYRPPLVARALCGFHDPPPAAWQAANDVRPPSPVGGGPQPSYTPTSSAEQVTGEIGAHAAPLIDTNGQAARSSARSEAPRLMGNPDEMGVTCQDNTFHVSALCPRICHANTRKMTRRDAVRRGIRECPECNRR